MTSQNPKPTRDEALAIAAARKTARRERTSKLRKAVAVLTAAAFIGPFGAIYAHVAATRNPAVASTAVTKTATTTAPSASTTSGSTTVSPVTTQQS
jgi:hypothetical protein